MIRLVAILLIAVVAITVLRMVIGVLARGMGEFLDPGSNGPARKSAGKAGSGGELKRDPVCGTFVSPDSSVTKKVGGEVIHFCSTACRDRYKG